MSVFKFRLNLRLVESFYLYIHITSVRSPRIVTTPHYLDRTESGNAHLGDAQVQALYYSCLKED